MFDLTTSRDFYAMLVADFDEYMAEPHSARRALHCAITAYHLREWVWRDWLEHDSTIKNTLGVHDKDSFNVWVNNACVWFSTVRDLANGTKHFGNRDKNFETMRVMAAPIAFDQSTAGLDQGARDGPSRDPDSAHGIGIFGRGCLVIDYGEGAGEHRWKPAAYTLEAVVRFWRDFFRKYRPACDLPLSNHHVDRLQFG